MSRISLSIFSHHLDRFNNKELTREMYKEYMVGDEFCCEGTFLYFRLEQFDFIKIEESQITLHI